MTIARNIKGLLQIHGTFALFKRKSTIEQTRKRNIKLSITVVDGSGGQAYQSRAFTDDFVLMHYYQCFGFQSPSFWMPCYFLIFSTQFQVSSTGDCSLAVVERCDGWVRGPSAKLQWLCKYAKPKLFILTSNHCNQKCIVALYNIVAKKVSRLSTSPSP